jgi:hypothetical protein
MNAIGIGCVARDRVRASQGHGLESLVNQNESIIVWARVGRGQRLKAV